MENSSTYNSERKLWLDALRGIAIILVVFGHQVYSWTEYFVFTSPIKMPLFFAISGYLFNPRSGNQKSFYKNILKKLIVPWMVLGLFPYVDLPNRFVSLVSGQSLWFMPCLVIAEILWFYVHKNCKTIVLKCITGLFLCIMGFLFHSFHIFHFAMVDIAFTVQIFFVIGLLIRQKEHILINYWRKWTSVTVTCYLFIGICVLFFFPGQCLDVHLNEYFNIPICGIMIIFGCVTLFTLFKQSNFSPNWLVYIGQNTLVIYILHGYAIALFVNSMQFLHLSDQQLLPLMGITKTIFGISLCCVIAFIINKYFPFIVGKKPLNGF